MTSLHFPGRTTLLAMDSAIESAVATWSHAWCCEPDAGRARSGKVAHTWQTEQPVIGLRHPSGGELYLAVGDADWKQVLFAERAIACPNDAIAQQVMLQSKQELLAQIFRTMGLTETSVAQCKPVHAPQILPHDGHVLTQITLAGLPIELLVNPVLMLRHAKAPATANERPLLKREQAAQTSLCRVSISLELGELPLTTLQNLAVGDTLQSDTPLTQSFQLAVGDNLKLPVFLGRVAEQKAITFVKQ